MFLGFDVNTIFDSGWTLLLVACSNGNLKIILELLNRGADINQNKGREKTIFSIKPCFYKISIILYTFEHEKGK